METNDIKLNGQYQTSRSRLFTQHSCTNNQSINQTTYQTTNTLNGQFKYNQSNAATYTTSHDDDSCNESVNHTIDQSTDHSVDSSLSAPVSPVTSHTIPHLNSPVKLTISDEESGSQSNEQPVDPSNEPVTNSAEQSSNQPAIRSVEPACRPRIPLSQVVASLNREWSMDTLMSAESGDVESMCLLGQMYAEGWGAINQSSERSKYWLKKAKQAGLGQHVSTIEKHMQQSSNNEDKQLLNTPSRNPSIDRSSSPSLKFWIRDSSTDSSGGSSNDTNNQSNDQSSHHQSHEQCESLYSPTQSRSNSQSSKSSVPQSSSQPSFFSTLVNAISPALKVRQAATVRSIAPASSQTNHASNSHSSRTVARSVSTDHLTRPAVRRSSTQSHHVNNDQLDQSLHHSVSDDDRMSARRQSHRLTHIGRSSYHHLFVSAS